jgi:sensor histidine kinase YesM
MLKGTARSLPLLQRIERLGGLFWLLNLSGWLGISLVTYLSLSLPYDQFETVYLVHNLLQSILGMFLCVPLRAVFRRIWDWPPRSRLLASVLAVLSLASTWAITRLLLFMAMTGELSLWAELGGWVFPSIFVFLTWAALYHGIKYYQLLQREQESLNEIENLQRREALGRAEARAEARDAQLELLRYQLNPHFLFNTLNSIKSLVKLGRSEQAGEMITRLSDFLRYSLEGDRATLVPLREEVQTLKLYLAIEQVRFSDRLGVEFDIPESCGRLAIPSMLLQPLVENSIKHAISRSEHGGIIRVIAEPVAESLRIVVEDSGTADKKEHEDDREHTRMGIGLTNTHERLRTLFGDAFRLTLTDSPLGGVRVEVTVPAAECL